MDDPVDMDQLLDQARDALDKKVYPVARRLYQCALRQVTQGDNNKDSHMQHCLQAMVKACLQSGQWEQAETYARRILADSAENNEPCLEITQCQLAQALLYQNQPHETMDVLMKFPPQKNRNGVIKSLFDDCRQAIAESRGVYNYARLLQEASLSPILPFHANYICSKIDLGVPVLLPWNQQSYRGVLAKEDIAEGTLLTSSCAFAFSCGKNTTVSKEHLYHVSQVHQAVQRLLQHPTTLARQFYQLEAAGEISEAKDDDDKEDDASEVVIDLPKIRSILESNRFGVDWEQPESPFQLLTENSQNEKAYTGVGLFLSTSMFNHSCVPNCVWAPIGNQMFVHASKDICKGKECCISYVHPAFSFRDRQERFRKWNGGKGFVCGCEWCHWMRQPENSELREMNDEISIVQKEGHVLSPDRWNEIQEAHVNVPLRFQHTMYHIKLMEALQKVNEKDRKGVMEATKETAKLGYAIRGGSRQKVRSQDLCCLAAAYMTCNEDEMAEQALYDLCRQQVVLPSLEDFQSFVLTTSMPIWRAWQEEPFMERWAALNQKVWEMRSKELSSASTIPL